MGFAASRERVGRLIRVPAPAANTAPGGPVKTSIFEAERLWANASKSRATFVALPSLEAPLFNAVPNLIDALTTAERDWSRLRFAGGTVNLTALRKEGDPKRLSQYEAARKRVRRTTAKKKGDSTPAPE